jgi:hypothetical protein
MESLVLNVLSFTLTAPTPRTFAKRYIKAACAGNSSIENKLTMLTNVRYFKKFPFLIFFSICLNLHYWTTPMSSILLH